VTRIRAIAAFWYDFVVGDDWQVAVGVVIALAGTYGLSRLGVAAWWLLPVAVVALLARSVRQAANRRGG
jgi:hypothetical protein